MKIIEHIYSNGTPDPIIIANNCVYIPENIQEITKETEDGLINEYEYSCKVYDKDEYIILMSQQTNRIAELEDELAAAKILLGVDE